MEAKVNRKNKSITIRLDERSYNQLLEKALSYGGLSAYIRLLIRRTNEEVMNDYQIQFRDLRYQFCKLRVICEEYMRTLDVDNQKHFKVVLVKIETLEKELKNISRGCREKVNL
ncbi:hypothetical protein M2454_000219 [Aequitasia blattaphilus]|uniref:Mobilization protein n=2 Tax=Lachnospiraceae TaxID=186803 RepID=A0ABT1EFY6_9FIRM|nr:MULTISPECIES: hypothetical protein [Lachnospiraceae]MCP1101000.1 hypothetical protein [Aequitasia blattaphilus]MCP1109593.1 hypothetical protein [Ohessyouella blattaphilus]MCR8562987.1 hypothetical protein [Ohessyouella blattaphilus]MCR8613640.1 hypothetical protein [Aequitasia blattaphilus]